MTAGATRPLAPSRTRGLSGLVQTPTDPLASTFFFATQAPDLWARQDGSSCGSPTGTPNELVVQISSQVTIPNFSSYYPSTPIQDFQMTYTTTSDGSLLSPPFHADILKGNWFILFVGMMLMLFLRNTVVSADYIRRGRVKYKGLFYALLASQALGVGAHVTLAGTFVFTSFDCTHALVAAAILTEMSSALLLSVILGVKAYRCLGNSRIVLVVVSILQAASSGLSFASIAQISSQRELGFYCASSSGSILFSIATALRSLLSLFICLCFLYALAKSIKFPAAQGRVSLRLSGVAGNNASPSVSEKEDPAQPRPRGWWDYVPDSQRKTENDPNQRAQTWNIVDDQGFIRNMRTMFGGWTGDTAAPAAFQDKESHLTTMPRDQSQQKSRRSTVRFSTRLPSDVSRMSINVRPPSPTPSKARSLSSLMDRMKPFRELMKNELAHAALITFFNVVATILGLVGAFGHSPIPQTVFVNSYWGILSLLVIHSFGRVIKRLEREAFVHHPSTWDPLYHVEKATNGMVRPGLSSASVASNPFRDRSMADLTDDDENAVLSGASRPVVDVPTSVLENPFEDFEIVSQRPHRQTEPSIDPMRPERLRSDSLLPDAPQVHSGQRASVERRGSRALLLRPMSEYTTSEYSFGSSQRQSLFYLEKQ